MSLSPLSRELALRIALAARTLPNTHAQQLLSILSDCVDAPLTDSNVAAIQFEQFKQAGSDVFTHLSDLQLQNALNILANIASDKILPSPEPYSEGDLPNSIRIACATDDAIHVNGHFGTCNWFLVYQVNASTARLLAIRDADIPEGLVVDDKNLYRAEQIHDCQVLYAASIGGPATAKVVKLGIHPLRLEQMTSLLEVINKLQQVMAGIPPPWLAKAMGIDSAERFKLARQAFGSS